jgi:hypothetical protein
VAKSEPHEMIAELAVGVRGPVPLSFHFTRLRSDTLDRRQ